MGVRNQSDSVRGTFLSDRRRHRRLAVRLSIVVRLGSDPSARATVERTVTRNISPGDVLFESAFAARLGAGDLIQVDIELPVEGPTIFSERRLQAQGRVARVEPPGPDGGPGSVAVVFEGPPVFHSATR